MPHPRILLLLLSGLVLMTAQAREFPWSGRGTIGFTVPDNWDLEGEADDEIGFTVTGKPQSKVAALLQITVIKLPPDKLVAESELPERLKESLAPYLDVSLEKEFRPMPLKLKRGRGWYAELTDASLVGKPPVPDDYKKMRNALLLLRDLLVVATMQYDDPETSVDEDMLAIVSSIRFERWPDSNPTVQTMPLAPALVFAGK